MTVGFSGYTVTIDLSGFTAAAPADGTIDPTSIIDYTSNTLQTGSAFGTVVVGQVVYINDFPVTIVTGTAVANVVTDINNLTYKHHAIASVSSGKLALINEPLYYKKKVSVSDGTAGITAQLGFVSPTISTVALPTLLSYSLAKTRANWRWKQLIQSITATGSIASIDSVRLTNVDLTFATAPTAISFNVSFDNKSYYGYDFSGNLVYGEVALQYAVAKALTATQVVVDTLYNPTVTTATPPPAIVAGLQGTEVTVGALTSNTATALAAVTVVNLVR